MAKGLLAHMLQQLAEIVAAALLALHLLVMPTDELHLGFFTWFKAKRDGVCLSFSFLLHVVLLQFGVLLGKFVNPSRNG